MTRLVLDTSAYSHFRRGADAAIREKAEHRQRNGGDDEAAHAAVEPQPANLLRQVVELLLNQPGQCQHPATSRAIRQL